MLYEFFSIRSDVTIVVCFNESLIKKFTTLIFWTWEVLEL